MNSDGRRTLTTILRAVDRWRYLGFVAPATVLLLIGASRSEIAALDTPAGFARYMALVAAGGLGVAVTRAVHHYLQRRYRPWQAPVPPLRYPWRTEFDYRWRSYGGLVELALMAGVLAMGAGLALFLLVDDLGFFP